MEYMSDCVMIIVLFSDGIIGNDPISPYLQDFWTSDHENGIGLMSLYAITTPYLHKTQI